MVEQMIRGKPPVSRRYAEMLAAQRGLPAEFKDMLPAQPLTRKMLQDARKELDKPKLKQEETCHTT